MTKGTSATRRGLGHAATRAASIIRFGLQREAAKGASSPRQMPDAAAKVEQLLTRVSAIPPHESSPVRPYRPKVQNGHNSSYVGRYRCRRSCRALHGPKRPHGERRVRSYGSRRGNHILATEIFEVTVAGAATTLATEIFEVTVAGAATTLATEMSVVTEADGSTATVSGTSPATATVNGVCACLVGKGNMSFNTATTAAAIGSGGCSGRPISSCYRQVQGRYGWRANFSMHLGATLTSAIYPRF